MGKLKIRRHAVDILFTLALFCVLAVTSLLVVVMGVGVYEGIVNRMGDNFDSRTSLTYISTKVRQNDQTGAVYLDKLGDGAALVLEQTIGGTAYQTWIYQSDGELRELFTNAENKVRAQEGQTIMKVDGLRMEEVGDGLLRVSIMDSQGFESAVLINTRYSNSAQK